MWLKSEPVNVTPALCPISNTAVSDPLAIHVDLIDIPPFDAVREMEFNHAVVALGLNDFHFIQAIGSLEDG